MHANMCPHGSAVHDCIMPFLGPCRMEANPLRKSLLHACSRHSDRIRHTNPIREHLETSDNPQANLHVWTPIPTKFANQFSVHFLEEEGISEIWRSLDFIRVFTKGMRPKGLILVGGGVRVGVWMWLWKRQPRE